VAVSKQTAQRITIGVIALIMTVGTLGAYFLIILQNNDSSTQSQASSAQTQYTQFPVDPTAYKVSGKVASLQVIDLTVGTGQAIKLGDKIRVQYKGTFAQTGQKFDSSYDNGSPATLSLTEGQLIEGWIQGLPGMKVGGKRRLIIPSNLGYGAQGQAPSIPPNTDLVFDVELLSIN
jgi:FKBP-type peptidyl-prolyl cis-trans isomerase